LIFDVGICFGWSSFLILWGDEEQFTASFAWKKWGGPGGRTSVPPDQILMEGCIAYCSVIKKYQQDGLGDLYSHRFYDEHVLLLFIDLLRLAEEA
jgi:hypothetical protein